VRAISGPNTPATNPFILGNAMGTDFARSDDRFRYHGVRATMAYRF
jgi:outer membrane immunogenic protein